MAGLDIVYKNKLLELLALISATYSFEVFNFFCDTLRSRNNASELSIHTSVSDPKGTIKPTQLATLF